MKVMNVSTMHRNLGAERGLGEIMGATCNPIYNQELEGLWGSGPLPFSAKE